MKVLAYAINGRGLGHLTRQLALLRQIRRITAVLGQRTELWLLTSSEGDTLARREGIPAIKLPSKSMVRDAGLDPARYLAIARGWVLSAVATLQPDLLLVDTFAAGSFGELVPVLELAKRRVLVRRAMKTGADKDGDALLGAYDRVLVPDEAEAPILLRDRPELLSRSAARAALGLAEDARVVWLALGGGGDPTTAKVLPRLVDTVVAAGWTPVVAAGPLYQGPERRGPDRVWLDRYATMELLPAADAAVSAGGYNSVHELRFVGVPTVFLPQEKLADDQAARALASGLGPTAARVEDVPGLLAGLGPVAPAGRNGAMDAAVAALSLVLDPHDVAAAARLWTTELASLTASGLDADASVRVLRLLAGDLPGRVARRRAVVDEVVARGGSVDLPRAHRGASVDAFFAACQGHPPAELLPVAELLARRFPAASPAELVDALGVLVPALAAWDDWVGVGALLRALPSQREYALRSFAADLVRWVDPDADAYDTLRRLHAAGDRPLAELLRL